MLGVKSSTLKTANEENCISQVKTSFLYLRDEFGDMMYWLAHSGRFNVLHLEDGSSLLVMGEDLTNLPSNIPQIAGQHIQGNKKIKSFVNLWCLSYWLSSKFFKATTFW